MIGVRAGTRAAGRAGGRAARGAWFAAAAVLLAGMGACDDQVKYVPWFETMYRQPSVGTYEESGRLPAEGAVPLGSAMHTELSAADTLTNPLADRATDEAVLERGRTLFRQYCVVCHGETGAGDGPATGVNRFPEALQTMNLTSDRSRALSDGYIFGMISNGRTLMPSYRRIPPEERWYIVNYVRQLQGNP